MTYMDTAQRTNALSLARRLATTAGALMVIASGAALALGAATEALSIIAGGLIAIASFTILTFVIIRSFGGDKGAGFVAAVGMVKMLALGALLWWLLRRGIVEPLAFLGGFSTMVVALLVEGLRRHSA